MHANQTIEFDPLELPTPITEIKKSNIYVYPTNDQIVYLTILGKGIFRSLDGAESWQPFKITGFDTTNVVAMAIYDNDPLDIYVATETELLRTTNGGDTWYKVLGVQELNGQKIVKIQRHPVEQGLMNIATANFLYYTYDSCATFRHKYFPDETPWRATVSFDTLDPDTFYVAYVHEGYTYTNDRGATWTNKLPPADMLKVGAVSVDPTNSNILYALWGRIWKSTNKGGSWQRLEKNDGAMYYSGSMIFDHQSPQPGIHSFLRNNHTYIAPGEETVTYRSGLPFYASELSFSLLAVSHQNHLRQYVVTEDGVYKTEDLGETWVHKNTGLESFTPKKLLFINPTDGFIFSTYANGLYKASGNWSAVQKLNWPGEFGLRMLQDVWLDPHQPNRQYTHTTYWANNILKRALFYSDDNWATGSEPIEVLSTSDHILLDMSFDAAPNGPAYTYLRRLEQNSYLREYLGIYKSGAPGEHWTLIDLNGGYPYRVLAMASDPNQANTLYVTTANQEGEQLATLRVNTSTGQYVKIGGEGSVFQTQRVAHITPDPEVEGRVYIGVFPTLDWDTTRSDQIANYRSDDYGQTWTPIRLPGYMLISPKNSDLLIGFHNLRNNGIVFNNDYFKSIDGGQSYQTFRVAYPVYPEESFVRASSHVFDPNDDNVLYFGTNNKGIWKMTFHGQASIYRDVYLPLIAVNK